MVVCTFKEGTVMSDVFAVVAEEQAAVAATVQSLPMAHWWDLDVYPLAAPVRPGGAA